jgi:cytochrome c-type biogenesis protein CcmH/NrfF
MKLRKETGLPLHQCRVFVNSYCDRNTLLPPARGLILWLVGSLTLGPLIAAFAILMTYFSFERNLDRSTPQATIHALRAGRIYLELAVIGIDAVFFCVLLISAVLLVRRARRDTADARKKMSGSNFATPK